MRSKKPDVKPDELLFNPFTFNPDFKIKVRLVNDYKSYTDKTGEKKPKEYCAEYDRFTKVYHSSDNRQSISLLKPHCQRLLLWLMYKLEPGKDWIWINVSDYMKENNLKDIRTYESAIKELARYNYILPTGIYKDVFWINPHIMFCGSRVEKYPKHLDIVMKFGMQVKKEENESN